MQPRQVDAGVVCELCIPCEIQILRAVHPRADNQSLQALLRLSKRHVVEVGDLCRPRVVPARRVVHRNVFVFGEVIDHARTRILPEAVVFAMAHRFDQPRLVVGGEFQRRRAWAQRKVADILSNPTPKIHERIDVRWVACRPSCSFCRLRRPWHVAEPEDPVHESEFKRPVVPHARQAEI